MVFYKHKRRGTVKKSVYALNAYQTLKTVTCGKVWCSELLRFWTFSIIWDYKTRSRRFGNWICVRSKVKGARRQLCWVP
jgi:hypothetical protein